MLSPNASMRGSKKASDVFEFRRQCLPSIIARHVGERRFVGNAPRIGPALCWPIRAAVMASAAPVSTVTLGARRRVCTADKAC